MKYRLKDKELQAKLEAIYPDFGEALSCFYGNQKDNTCITFLLDQGIEVKLFFRNSVIEEVPEYDPKAWNKWPEVQPPKRGFYRVEIMDPDFFLYHYVMLWKNDVWHHAEGRMDRLNLDDGQEVRFKPWDDEEPDEDDDEEDE
ncbi:hypothetical protein [Sutterella wadsworthensis]|uniref:hypothetical protein n=1 Tax=Sutterella wadsworthensis TaxID=40545 RepID=UPI003AF0A13F